MSKKLYIASIYRSKVGRNKDTSDADLEEYFGKYGKVVGVSQEMEMGGGKKKAGEWIEVNYGKERAPTKL